MNQIQEFKHKFEGSNYQKTKDMGLKQIAELIREDLKKYAEKCRKVGFLIKFSVRTEYYSMGQSLHITLQEANFKVYNPEFDPNEHENRKPINTEKFYKLKSVVDKIVNSYNYDNSDSMVDYFDVKFYHSFHIGERIREAEGIN